MAMTCNGKLQLITWSSLRATPASAYIWSSTPKFGGLLQKSNSNKASIWACIFHTPPNSPSQPPCLESLQIPLQNVGSAISFSLSPPRGTAHTPEGPIRRTRERGSEWEPIKILLEGDRGSNKMNTTSNTRLRLNYTSWSRPRSHWSATDHVNQQTPFRAKTHRHAQRKLARLAACATPVRPMACIGQTCDTSQTGGQSRSGRWLQQPHNKCSREPQ
jgi:hypothetical protein